MAGGPGCSASLRVRACASLLNLQNRVSIWKDAEAAGKPPTGALTIKVNAGAAEGGEASGMGAAPESPPAFGDGNVSPSKR